jgi:hypothetical protein
MIKNHADASTDNPLNSRHPLDTKPSGDTAALMAPMASQSDAEAAQMRECVRAAEDTVKASGTTYYVSNTGSDSNPGDSPSRAWASVEKVNRWNLRAGDAVLFHRGDIFRGTITARSGVSYGAYGTGDKPAIYGARENAVGADWLEEPGNIWSLDTGVFNDIGHTYSFPPILSLFRHKSCHWMPTPAGRGRSALQCPRELHCRSHPGWLHTLRWSRD